MKIKPILAFQYLDGDTIYFYHTDGEILLGPTLVSFAKLDFKKNSIFTSYLNIMDPDSPQKMFYKTLFSNKFKTKKEFEDALADVIMDFRIIYDTVTEALPYEKIFDRSPLYYKFAPYPSIAELGSRLESV